MKSEYYFNFVKPLHEKYMKKHTTFIVPKYNNTDTDIVRQGIYRAFLGKKVVQSVIKTFKYSKKFYQNRKQISSVLPKFRNILNDPETPIKIKELEKRVDDLKDLQEKRMKEILKKRLRKNDRGLPLKPTQGVSKTKTIAKNIENINNIKSKNEAIIKVIQ